MSKLGVLFLTSDPNLKTYAAEAIKQLEAIPRISEIMDSLPLGQHLTAISVISETIIAHYEYGHSIGEAVALVSEAIISSWEGPTSDVTLYAQAVHAIVFRDNDVRRIAAKTSGLGQLLMTEALAELTVQNFKGGISPEETAQKFIGDIVSGWNQAELAALQAMDIKEVH